MHLYGKNNLSCGQPGCALKFFTFTGFTKHLRIAHSDSNLFDTVDLVKNRNNNNICNVSKKNNIHIPCESENACSNTLQENCVDAVLVSQTPTTNKVNCTTDLILTNTKFKSVACNFVSQLSALGMTDKAMDSVINTSTELVTVIANSVNAVIQSGQIDHLQNHLKDVCDVLKSINSSYKRKKFFREEMRIVPVIEINFGIKAVTRFDRNTGASKVVVMPRTFIYVSIIDSLKFLLENETLRGFIVNPQTINKQYFANYTDGLHCTSHDLFSKYDQSLKIMICYDEFHVENALGSKKNKHKLGAIYFQLKNIPPVFNSQQ